MASNEEDKDSIEKSIKSLEDELQATKEEAYTIAMKRKFLNHRIADLKYELKHKG